MGGGDTFAFEKLKLLRDALEKLELLREVLLRFQDRPELRDAD